jgi:hypothetical protein
MMGMASEDISTYLKAQCRAAGVHRKLPLKSSCV